MKELEDLRWFPRWMRNYQTDFLGYACRLLQVYNRLQTRNLKQRVMIDLCSGDGSPGIDFFRRSRHFHQLLLTDKFPRNIQNKHPDIRYANTERDVLREEFSPECFYTMFNAFHHLDDDQKRDVVKSLQQAGAAGLIVEILEPTFTCMLKIILITTAGTLALTPFLKPFSIKRLLFTYIFPVIPVTVLYDGVVSVLKSRSAEEYLKIVGGDNNEVRIMRLGNCPVPLTVISINLPDENFNHSLGVQPSAHHHRERSQHHFAVHHPEHGAR